MKFLWFACVALILIEGTWTVDEDLMTKLEKELKDAETKKSSKSMLSSMDSVEDMTSLMEKLEAELRAKEADDKGKSISDFKAAMEKLEKEMEAAAKKQTKRSLEQSLDELMDEIKNGRKEDEEEANEFRKKFYKIIGYEKKEVTAADEKAVKRMMLKSSLSQILNDLSGVKDIHSKRESNEDSECKDNRNDCKSLAGYCQIPEYKEKLKGICAKTCKYCRECKNVWSDDFCKYRESLCFNTKYSDILRENCYKTCDYCKAPAPPKCSATKYGCCWNKETTKQDPDGQNCPECVDKYRYACKTFEVDCSSMYTPGDFMRRECPKTCKLCSGSTICVDDVKHRNHCTYWNAQLDWCNLPEHRERMRHLCPKTCGFC